MSKRSLFALRGGLIGFALALASGGCGGGNGRGPAPTPTTAPAATPTAPAATPTVVPFPPTAGAGLLSDISDVTVMSSGEIVVTFTVTDAEGIPLTAVLEPARDDQEAQVYLTIAHVEHYSPGQEFDETFTRYVNDIDLIRPRFDSGGTLERIDPRAGVYRYTFTTRLPEDFDPTLTYTVGLQVDRIFAGELLGSNPVFDVVPAGGDPEIFAASTTAQCNACHDPLIQHGNRREFRLCTLCHTEAAEDGKDRTIDLRVMIHKIHRGIELPSIADGPPGAEYALFNSVLQRDVIFAEKLADSRITGVQFPRKIETCDTCHHEGATAEFHTTQPAAAACASCHDDVNPSPVETAAGPPGTGHFQNEGFVDGFCALCHIPDSGDEFDISVAGAHMIPERSRQLVGLNLEITGLINHHAGQTPTVRFKVTDNAGTPLRDLSVLDRLALAMGGPTTDYATRLDATVVGFGASGTLIGPDPSGVFDYTSERVIPETASGTWTIGVEARRLVELETSPDVSPKVATEAATNPVVTFTVDDSAPLVRRSVVEISRCGSCHGEFSVDFSVHGSLRNQVDYCVICHNPNQSDAGLRGLDPEAVARGEDVAMIDFKFMIHHIHTGAELHQKPYLIYGFSPQPPFFQIFDFSDLQFPGDRRNCVACHIPGTQLMPPFPGTALGTEIGHLDPDTGQEVVDGRIGPITSVCTACHDSDAAVAHAETQTTPSGGEACTVCHGEGRDVAVSLAHAR